MTLEAWPLVEIDMVISPKAGHRGGVMVSLGGGWAAEKWIKFYLNTMKENIISGMNERLIY
jgi:hypothetical protein